MECRDCDFYKEVGPGWVCTDEEDWRNNGDPCFRYHPNASLTLFEGVTKEAHDKLKADYAALSAERDRPRGALEEIAGNFLGGFCDNCNEMRNIACYGLKGDTWTFHTD